MRIFDALFFMNVEGRNRIQIAEPKFLTKK